MLMGFVNFVSLCKQAKTVNKDSSVGPCHQNNLSVELIHAVCHTDVHCTEIEDITWPCGDTKFLFKC